jgi:hypothetical protein
VATGRHGTDFGTHQLHAGDIQGLPLHVHGTHIDDALHAEARTHGGGRHAVLAGSGFSNDALLAEALCQQDLADGVVNLVRAGVQQVLALQVDLRAAQLLGPSLGEIQRRRTADVVRQQVIQLALEFRVLAGGIVGLGQLLQRGH